MADRLTIVYWSDFPWATLYWQGSICAEEGQNGARYVARF